MSSKAIDLTDASPPIASIPSPSVKREQTLPIATVPREQVSEQNSYFLYKKECRLAWIKYLGLLGKVKLRKGPDRLPFFIGMPPEHLTFQVDAERLAVIQQTAMSDPRNSLITLGTVLKTLRDRPRHTHIAWDAVQQKLANSHRDQIKHWESASSRNPVILLQSTQASSGQTPVHKVIQSAMNRLVGIRTQEDDPPSCPGYVLPMASFERAVMNAEKAKDDIQRRQWADMSLRSLRNFMDAQKNEAVIDKMVEFQKHYEALAAVGSK
ncbi:hypothetical protein AU210_005148 [Fusarium oxysporum f. sp. radicis-cucumerinum]|uniref:Uncharacterized protein n=2 Tax=Fusarium oxysporum TaxID=5507 RepID=A0A2H3HIL2_FUSOX|nr:hypothetical protein AU210_005148 [Fusarium oxysporum f. sp. radicis-cucumerinum]RKK25218.1 hypothetical protein BFJ65_g3125 [Fusarium oxysporum f. sp. cepae]RKK44256.1 hypothetical protein BFJ66_g9633 [Fusarium oxysporum f. sp. cepae]RKK55216.1 hypothetical protein BFJ67_g4317 [Fusarium oxysporum f. sp. cepae]